MHHTCAFFADCTNHEKNINKAAGQDDVLAAFCTQLMYRMKSYVCVYVFCSVYGHVHISKCATYYCTFIRASGQSPFSLSLLSIKCPILLNPKNCTPMQSTFCYILYNLRLFEWGNLYQVYYKHGHSATEQVYLDAYDAWLRETSRLIEVYKRKAGSQSPLSSIFHNKNIYRMHFSLQML